MNAKRFIKYAFIFLGVLFMLFFVIIPLASAQILTDEKTNNKHIAIDFSASCLTIIELGDLVTCSTPEFYKMMYDESKLMPSVQKQFNDSPNETANKKILMLHKKACMLQNYCNAFDNYGSTFYWYDIDNELRGYMDQIITITPNILHKSIISLNTTIIDQNNTKTRHLELEIDHVIIRSCYQITYNPTPKIMLDMGLIMWYLSSDCKDIEKLGYMANPFIKVLPKYDFDISTSPNYLYLKELEALKSKYKENRIGLD